VNTMKDMKAFVNSLPLVASALGRKYSVKVVVDGCDAYTDGRTIHIPSLPLNADADLLTVARGYLDHEAGHIRHTNFKNLDKLDCWEKYATNVLEDVRIERRMADEYPGCAINIRCLIKKLFVDDSHESGFHNTDLEYLATSWLLHEVRSWDVPAIGAKAAEAEQKLNVACPALIPAIRPLLGKYKMLLDAGTAYTEDSVHFGTLIGGILRDAYYLSKQQQRQTAQSTSQEGDSSKAQSEDGQQSLGKQGSKGKSQGDSSKSNSNPDEGDANADHSANASGSSDGDEEASSSSASSGDADSPDDGDDASSSAGRADGSGKDGDEDEDGDWEGDDNCLDDDDGEIAAERDTIDCSSSLPDGDGHGGCSMPQPPYFSPLTDERLADILRAEHITTKDFPLSVAVEKMSPELLRPMSNDLEASIMQTTAALRARLVGLLQAKTQRGFYAANAGRRISTRTLHSIATGSTRLFLRTTERKGVDTAVHILLDKSASMDSAMDAAMGACYSVASALLQNPHISVGITAFPGRNDEEVLPILKHGAPMPRAWRSVVASGTTPIAEAVLYCLTQLAPLPHKRKILLVISDGEPNMTNTATEAFAMAGKGGIELFGIHIARQSRYANKPRGLEKFIPQTVAIASVGDLPSKLFALLTKALIQL